MLTKNVRLGKRLLKDWYDYRFNHSSGLFVSWAITGRCNSRCIFCEAHEQLLQSQDMPMELVEKTIDQLAEMKVRTVVLIGGEPLVRKDIWEIIERLHDKGMRPCLITNGLLLEGLDESKLQLLNKCNSSVTVSIDSADPAQNDAIRGIKGAYKKTTNGIVKLRSAGISVVMSTVITKQNIEQIPALCKLCAQLKVERVVFQPISHTPFFEKIDAKKEKRILGLVSENELTALKTSIEDGISVSKTLNVKTDLPLFKLWVIEYFRSRLDIDNIEPRFYDKVMVGFACRVVQYRVFIDYNGSIKSCQLLPAIGNVKDMSIKEAWDKLKPLRYKLKRHGPLKVCDNCFCNTEDNFTIGMIEHPFRNLHMLKVLIS